MARGTTVRKDSEDVLVKRIARAVPSHASGSRNGILKLGIGDDAAILRPRSGMDWVLSCDAFLEGVHFLREVHPPESVGYKSLARAASDLAAMGAVPELFLLTLALPASATGKWLDRFLRGLARAARSLRMTLAGGDTSKTHRVAISVTVLGTVPRGRGVTRSGARPGDTLFVSGALGCAQLGLELVRRDLHRRRGSSRFLRQHLFPAIRLELGAWLARRRIPSAMMDLSDGLSTDLARLCRASGVGARIWADRIPKVQVPSWLAEETHGGQLDPLHLGLHGGDDYELLFAVPKQLVRRLRNAPAAPRLTSIGTITRQRGILLVDANGRASPLRQAGWDPFRTKSH